MKTDEENEVTSERLAEIRDEVKIDRLSWVDYVIALLLGGGVFALLWLWRFPILEPNTWQRVAEAAGTRPPQELCPGLWRVLVAGLFRLTSLSGGLAVLPVIGKVVIGACAAFSYLTFRGVLSLTIRLRLQYSPQRYFVARMTSALGAVLFACSNPVWRAGQTFSKESFLLLLTIWCLYLFFTFLQDGRLLVVYAAMFSFGVLSAETPVGLVLVAFCWGTYFMAVRHVLSFEMPLMNPFIEQVSKWHMTFLFVLGLLGGIFGNCISFSEMGGLAATGWSIGDLPLRYALRLWGLVTTSGSLVGWVIAFGVVVMPLAVSAGLLPRAADEDMFLPYHFGVIYLCTGLLALAQFCQIDALWFWTWIKSSEMISSPYMLCVFMFALGATLVFSVTVLGIDSLCRNHRRLAMQRFAEMRQDLDNIQSLAGPGVMKWARRIGCVLFPLLLLASSLPGRRLAATREMLSIIGAYAHEVLEEAGPVTWLFTDGSYDPLLEVWSAAEGHRLRPISMMGQSAYDRYLRTHGVEDAEDKLSLEVGAPMALRSWTRDKKERLADVAIQLGFEIWKRDGKALPACSGVLARPGGMPEDACARGVEAARALGARILAFYKAGGPKRNAGRRITDLFLFAQWRIARLARLRAERADLAGNAALALEDVKLSEELDDQNASLKRILEGMERMRQVVARQITPREGLQMALTRADFALARRYAEPILQADPEEPQANFGMGMSYFVQEQWTRAEEYLRRCLVRNPKEPAVYNNLAVLQMRTGRYDAAEKSARHALALIPESAEVKDTLNQVLKARDEAKAKEIRAKKRAAEEARRRAEEDA